MEMMGTMRKSKNIVFQPHMHSEMCEDKDGNDEHYEEIQKISCFSHICTVKCARTKIEMMGTMSKSKNIVFQPHMHSEMCEDKD